MFKESAPSRVVSQGGSLGTDFLEQGGSQGFQKTPIHQACIRMGRERTRFRTAFRIDMEESPSRSQASLGLIFIPGKGDINHFGPLAKCFQTLGEAFPIVFFKSPFTRFGGDGNVFDIENKMTTRLRKRMKKEELRHFLGI